MEQLDLNMVSEYSPGRIRATPGSLNQIPEKSLTKPLGKKVDDAEKSCLIASITTNNKANFRKGSVTSITVSDSGAIQPYHLLPMLAHCSHKSRWLMWLSPHMPLNKRWLATQGLTESPIVHIDLCEETQMYLCERILKSGNSHMIIEWQGMMNDEQRNKIRVLAKNSGTQVVLINRDRDAY
ncbi:MAG: cell division inhibitor SulA [Oceanobacter sp.]